MEQIHSTTANEISSGSPTVDPRMKNRRRIGIIGCGAVTEVCHLPAARHSQSVDISVLVDLDLTRARSLGEQYGAAYYSDYTTIFEKVDGVIIATPHYLHAPVATAFLERNIPVLI